MIKFKAGEIASVIQAEIETYRDKIDAREVGRVLEVGDGIARVYGLTGVMSGEMVEFSRTGARGMAFNLEETSVGIVILGDYLEITEGDDVRTTGQLLQVPVGEAMVGRVVDPLGRPMDGKGEIITTHFRPLETVAPGVAERQPVNQALQTGIKAIDSMTPVGRGQRELIIGDRKTGKTAIAIDTIINQKEENVICVYVAVGQKESTVAGLVENLRKQGAMDYTIVVVASSSVSAPLQYIAPYAGCAMAEFFMYEQGKDTLCVYDDLSKQAAAYRQLSLLMRRPPGREAYPGDVFYCHSRLLERSAKCAENWVVVPKEADEKKVNRDWGVNSAADPKRKRNSGEGGKVYIGKLEKLHALEHDLAKFPGCKLAKVPGTGGSLTALPVIETLEGEVSAYIPTNVISITDGQIYLQPSLFFAGVRPAVDVGISVSRVGGNAQIPAMKSIAGGLRLDIANFRSLEAFAQLGTELDKATQSQLDRGYRIVEVLKQPQYKPMPVVDQVMIIYAATKGYIDTVPIKHVRLWEEQFLHFMAEQQSEIRSELKSGATLAPRNETPAARVGYNTALELIAKSDFKEALKSLEKCGKAYAKDVAALKAFCQKKVEGDMSAVAPAEMSPKPPTLEDRLQAAIHEFIPQFKA